MAKAVQAVASARMLLAFGDADGACNRAYYAMFDAARAVLLASGYEIGKTHSGILNAFSERFVKNSLLPKEIGRLLKHAETFRYVADYESESVDESDAQKWCNKPTILWRRCKPNSCKKIQINPR